ncbi:MAG TPA: hypothetical protein VMP08_19755 [Anaerolineae bacterium]|nr:hypothetical protein [Anaerolineae bacterium]
MGSFNRRHFLKLSATLLVTAGCQSVLKQIGQILPTTTPTAAPTSTRTSSPVSTSTTAPSVLPTPTVSAPLQSPLVTPQGAEPAPKAIATVEPDLKLTPPPGGSKIGLHVVFGSRDGIDEFLSRCAGAGRPVPLVKCVDDFEVAFKAKHVSDKTLTVGRVNAVFPQRKVEVDMQAWEPPEFKPPPGTRYTTAQEAAQQYYALVKPTWQLNPVIDVWETFNEYSGNWDWQADFYIALMDLAEADGYRLGLWSASAGNPPEEVYPAIARTCQRAKAHGNHIMCLHEYNLDGLLKDAPKNMVTRYRQLYQYLRQQDAVIPLVISEAGENAGGKFTGVETFMQDFAWYDQKLSRDDYVIGCAAWTLGDWSGANIQAALPALGDYISGELIIHHYPPRAYLPLIANEYTQ